MQGTQLLAAIAEQLKLPLTAIVRHAELGQLIARPEHVDLSTIRMQASAALTLVDSYLLGLQLMHEQGKLQLEPVSVSSVLTDTAHQLHQFAKQYGVELELHIGGKFAPVMAHRLGFRAALISMGHTLIESQTVEGKHRRIAMAVNRSPHGIVAGMYGEYEALSTARWRQALQLCGRARQPFNALAIGSGAGVFVADAILQAMDTRLRVGRHHKQTGLCATLLPSQQLQLV
ncbi:MAG TPA: hypothetical protein VMY99_05520 [Nevskiaceae bacterium]|nr:hypothetical protein [Nevskiaceae bacterium]